MCDKVNFIVDRSRHQGVFQRVPLNSTSFLEERIMTSMLFSLHSRTMFIFVRHIEFVIHT